MKLADRCLLFDIKGINILGCPETGVVYGLSEVGYQLVSKLMRGKHIDLNKLSEEEKELYEDMLKEHFFENEYINSRDRAAYIHITEKCDMQCIGCYSRNECRIGKKKELSLDEWKIVIDNLHRASIKKIVISGGEPYFRDDIEDLIVYIKSKGINVSCISNGMRDIEKYVNSSCDTLCISMDYGTEGRRIRSGDNELIKERIRQIVKAGKKVYIIFNLHAMNIDKLDEMTAFAKEIGSKYNFSLFTAPVDDINQPYQITLSEKCLDKLIKRDRNEGNGYIEDAPDTDCIGCRKSCGAGKNLIAVASDGKLYPCHMFLNSKYILGNALTENIGEILDKADFQNIISVEHKPECSDCEYKYVCGGGCSFRGLSVGGSIECKDSMCTAYQQLYNETMIKLLA